MSEVRPGPARAVAEPVGSLTARVAALLVLVAAVNLWLTHHFRVGVQNPLALVPGVGVAGTLVMRVMRPGEKHRLEGWLEKQARVLLSERCLLVLYLVAATFMATVSTITIVRDTPDRRGAVEIVYVDSPGRQPDSASLSDSVLRFVVLTTPLGRTVRVTATGFVPTTFTVSPPVGLALRLGQDLPVSPSVLLRPGVLGLRSLDDGGSLYVYAVLPRDTTLVGRIGGVHSAVLLGTPQPISAAIEDWRLELTGLPPELRDRMLLAWKRPVLLRHHASIGPGTTLIAEVWSRTHTLVGRGTVELGTERVLDVPVPDLASSR
jgi:hypothetical protein